MLNKIIKLISKITLKRTVLSVVGAAILAFGLYNVHSLSGVSEGGVLGLTLLLHHHFGISPAVTGFVLNAACYCLGMKILGGEFILYSIISGGGFSIFYAIFEQFEPVYPEIAEKPLVAAIVGAIFVGVGVGLAVRSGGAPGGDDALAMSLSHITGKDIRVMYLSTDIIVLLLSLTYIPLSRIMYSLLTVLLSGQIIGFVQNIGAKNGIASDK